MKKIIQKTFRFRLKPTTKQFQKMAQIAGSCRYIYNYSLNYYKDSVVNNQNYPTYKDIANLLPGLKRNPETDWLKDVPAQSLQQAVKDFFQALEKFYKDKKKGKKSGFPKYRKKFINDSFRLPQNNKIEGNKIYVPKIGWVRYISSQPIEGTIKQVTVKREGDHWYICIVCQIEKEVIPVKAQESKIIGLDVGLLTFATLSNGETITNPKYLKQQIEKLQSIQRRLSKAKKGGENRKKLVKKIRRLHACIRNQRNDFLHKFTTYLVQNYDVIVVEDLNIQGMLKNHRLAFAIADVAWGKFFSLLEYKCDWYGKELIMTDRFFASSKICSSCGAKQDMPLGKRTYKCSSCNLILDRDLNASINIREVGISFLQTRSVNACGAENSSSG